jgi:peroxiredoxin
MARSDDLYELPSGLPVPEDDGACAHLTRMRLPSVQLRATGGGLVDISSLAGRAVVYCYPRTGRPDQELPTGWNDIPGARGCTPQSCAFRDHYQDLRQLGINAVYGLSSQDTAYQKEAVKRLHLPFELLSDEQLNFASALGLPTFEVDGMTLIKRLTLIVHYGVVEHVFYPVFPPDSNAPAIVHWLVERTTGH